MSWRLVFRKVIFISRESHHSHSAKAVVHLVSTEKHPTKETPPAAYVLHWAFVISAYWYCAKDSVRITVATSAASSWSLCLRRCLWNPRWRHLIAEFKQASDIIFSVNIFCLDAICSCTFFPIVSCLHMPVHANYSFPDTYPKLPKVIKRM